MTEKWNYSGKWVMSCNCDYGCPCNFNAYPTRGNCQGIVACKISDGKYGKTSLKGVSFVSAVWWPKAIHELHGIGALYVDEKAKPAQVEALGQIVSGQAGGMPWGLFAKTFDKLAGPKKVPMTVSIKGKDTVIKAGDVIDVKGTTVKNPVTGSDHFSSVQMKTFLIFAKGDIYANEHHRIRDPDIPQLNWEYHQPERTALITADVKHKGP